MAEANLKIIVGLEDKASRGLGNLHTNVQSLGKLALGAALGGVAALGAGLGALIGSSTISAARVSETAAVLNLLGERAGWSAQEIKDNVEAMKDLGIRTDVAQDVLAQFARQQLDVADATMAARTAQDLAVLSGRDSSETLSELIYMVQTQNSGLQVARDLGIQTGAALDVYAKSIGKTTEGLSAAERQQAMLNAVQEASLKIAGTYETAMQEPGKAMRSLSRHFYEARIAIGQAFLPAMSNVVAVVTDGIKSFRGLLEEGKPLNRIFGALGEIATAVTSHLFNFSGGADVLTEMLFRVADVVEAVAEGITYLSDIVIGGKLADALQEFGPLEFLVQAFGDLLPAGVMKTAIAIDEFVAKAWEMIKPVVDAIAKFVSWKDVLIVLGIAIASVIIPILISIVTTMLPIIATAALLIAAVALLRNAWENDWGGIRTALTGWWDNTGKPIFETLRTWLQENIPIAIQILKDFWEDVLLPAITRVWDWLSGTLIPWIRDTLVPWLEEKITAALSTLADFWEQTLWPAIQNVWNWMDSVLIPFIVDTLVPWLQEKIPEAIQTLSDFWTETLQPALEDVWDFLDEYVIPIFEALWELLQVAGGVATLALSNLWTDTLKPALEGVWKFIQDDVIPILESLWEWFNDKIAPVINDVMLAALENLKDALEGIRNAIQWVIDKLIIYKNTVTGVQTPEDFQEHSPSPFAASFLNAGEAIAKLTRQRLPELQLALNSMAGMGAASAAAGTINYNYHLTAQYGYQSQSSLEREIRMLEMLHR